MLNKLYPIINVNPALVACLTLSSDLYLGCQRKVDVEFQNKVKALIHIITENRVRRASGPVHSLLLKPLHILSVKPM